MSCVEEEDDEGENMEQPEDSEPDKAMDQVDDGNEEQLDEQLWGGDEVGGLGGWQPHGDGRTSRNDHISVSFTSNCERWLLLVCVALVWMLNMFHFY